MFLIKHTHGSGLFSKSPALLEKDLDTWAKDSNLITVTEVIPNPRAKMLAEQGWSYYRGERTKMAMDVAAMWKTSAWRLIHKETVQTTKKRYVMKGGKLRDPMGVIFVVLEHRQSKKRLCLCVGHFPSSVEGSKAAPGSARWRIWKKPTTRVTIFLESIKSIKKAQRRIYRGHKCHAKMIVADWNMNLKRAKIRDFINKQFPDMKVTWRNSKKLPGTHGRRLIDYAVVGPKKRIRIIRWATIRKKTKASDHTAFKHTLAFPR